jgi:hypothetical protein
MTDVWLIRDDYKEVACTPEPIERCFGLGIQMKAFKLSRRKAATIAHFRYDEHSVAIKEYRTTPGEA